MVTRIRTLSLLAGLWLVGAAAVLPAVADEATGASLTFVKEFKGSLPEYVHVTVNDKGEATFEGGELDASRDVQTFRLSPATTGKLFALASELRFFRDIQVESPHQVAYLGKKTFTYEKGAEKNSVSYNWTQDATANQLQQLFERIARGRYLLGQLEFQLQFDRLGMLGTMREFEREFNTGGLVDLEQFAPMLERLAGDKRLMRLVQSRAEALLRRVRGAPGRLEIEYGDQRSGWYYRLIVDETGATNYESRRYADPGNPQPLALPQPVVTRLLELVRQGDYLRGLGGYRDESAVLSGYRVTYEAGAEHNEVSFVVPPAAVLAEMVHIFKQLLLQELLRTQLRTGVQEGETVVLVVLQDLDEAVRQNALLEPKEFIPPLEEIANGNGYSAEVREQAGRLLARIRSTP